MRTFTSVINYLWDICKWRLKKNAQSIVFKDCYHNSACTNYYLLIPPSLPQKCDFSIKKIFFPHKRERNKPIFHEIKKTFWGQKLLNPTIYFLHCNSKNGVKNQKYPEKYPPLPHYVKTKHYKIPFKDPKIPNRYSQKVHII